MSNKGGQATYTGTRYQKFVTLTLFLQHFYDKELLKVGIENPDLDDAFLEFSNKRFITQAKFRKYGISIPTIKEIFERPDFKLEQSDEFILITNKANRQVTELFDSTRYDFFFSKQIEKYKIEPQVAEKIKKSYLWVIDEDKAEELIQARASEILGIYLPPSELQGFVAKLLNIIDKGATGGKEWSAKELKDLFETEIQEIRNNCKSDSGYNKKIEEINEITRLVKSGKLSRHDIEKYSSSSDAYKIKYLIELIAEDGKIDLQDSIIHDLLNAALRTRYPYLSSRILDLVKAHSTASNAEQILKILIEVVQSNIFYFEPHKIGEVFEILDCLIQDGCDLVLYLEKILIIIKKCLEPNIRSHFFNHESHSSPEEDYYKNLSGKTFKYLYEKGSDTVKQDVINFIFSNYNLIKDIGRYFDDVPLEIYQILAKHLADNFEELFDLFIAEIAKDFDEDSLTKRSFDGWETHGTMVDGTNGIMETEDRAIITHIFQPALGMIYSTDPARAYKFVKNNFVVDERKLVTRNKPYFLNRVAIPYLINEINGSNNEEATSTINRLLGINSGLLSNADIVSENLLKKIESIQEEDIWRIISHESILSGASKIPTNSWAEQIVTELALRGSTKSTSLLKEWFVNTEFIINKRRWMHSELGAILRKLLLNEKTFQLGIDIIKGLVEIPDDTLNTNEVIEDISDLLKIVISKDFNSGLGLLKELQTKIRLDRIYQAINEVTNTADLNSIYKEFYEPLVNRYSKGINISEEVRNKYDRISIISFGEKLIQYGLVEQGCKLYKLFLNDPDPIEGDISHTEVKNGQDHISTSTVRGDLAFALRYTTIPEGIEMLPEAIEQLAILINDPNFSVRAYSAMSLIDFMRARYFLPDLNDARKIEKIFWNTINKRENQEINWLMTMLATTFNYMRLFSKYLNCVSTPFSSSRGLLDTMCCGINDSPSL